MGGFIGVLILIGIIVWVAQAVSKYRPDLGAAELQELRVLYARAQEAGTLQVEDAERYVGEFFRVMELDFSEPIRGALRTLMWSEGLPRHIDFDLLNLQERIELRRTLVQWEMKNQNEGAMIKDFLLPTFIHLAQQLPKTGHQSPFRTSVASAMTNPKQWISEVTSWLFHRDNFSIELFGNLRTQLFRNLCLHSGIDPDSMKNTKPFKDAKDSALPPHELADTYLRHTPFYDIFTSEVPLRFSQEDRFSHMHIVGGTGSGKTTLLESLILHDIKSTEPPSLVVIDPHSDLIRKLLRTDLGIADRVILIDPRDIENPPALNIFALNKERMAKYDAAQREQVVAGVIETYEFLFSGFGIDLTGKQAVLFRNVCRVMLLLPETMGRNATILDMMRIMADSTPYAAAIAALPEIPRDFFARDFKENTFRQTKEEIRYRLQAVLENPTMARLFTSAESKLDLFTELNAGSIILVDTAEDFLKGASADYGRVFITLILQAILERSVVEEGGRKPTFIYIDEAASFFSQNLSKMLTDARKYKAGLILSHQFLDQATPALRASLAANTASKFVSGLSAKDASAFASDMRTTADFILNQPKYHFAAHMRGVTPQAISIPVSDGAFKPYLHLPREALEALLVRNRARLSLTKALPQRSTYREPVEPEGPVSSPQQSDPPKESRLSPLTDDTGAE